MNTKSLVAIVLAASLVSVSSAYGWSVQLNFKKAQRAQPMRVAAVQPVQASMGIVAIPVQVNYPVQQAPSSVQRELIIDSPKPNPDQEIKTTYSYNVATAQPVSTYVEAPTYTQAMPMPIAEEEKLPEPEWAGVQTVAQLDDEAALEEISGDYDDEDLQQELLAAYSVTPNDKLYFLEGNEVDAMPMYADTESYEQIADSMDAPAFDDTAFIAHR